MLTVEQKKILKDVTDDSKEKATNAKAKTGDKDALDAKPKK